MQYKVTIGNGKNAKVRTLEIDRVPYKVFIIAQAIEKKTEAVRKMALELIEIETEIDESKKIKRDGWKDTVRELKDKAKDIEKEIYAIEDSGFFAERFEAIKLILLVNGYKEDDEILDIRTWSEKMDYADPMAFIEACCQKDTDKKKVIAEALASLTKKG